MPVVWFILFWLIVLICVYPKFFAGLIAAIGLAVTIHKINKSNREEIERQERVKEAEKREWENKERRLKEEEKKRVDEKRREDELSQAVSKGIDVCRECKTITPNRCVRCHKCISCWSNRSSRYSHLCSHCGQGVASRECAYAESHGKDVCWDCLTVEPLRCYCGNCTICYGHAGWNECNSCSSDDDD